MYFRLKCQIYMSYLNPEFPGLYFGIPKYTNFRNFQRSALPMTL